MNLSNLYAIKSSFGLKVGRAIDVERRMDTLAQQVQEPLELVYLAVIDKRDVVDAEYLAHRLLDNHWLYGEWYNCSEATVRAAIDKAVRDYSTVDRRGEKQYLRSRIEQDRLLELIALHGGRIRTKDARSQMNRPIGFSIQRLHMAGAIEPWSDALVLTETGERLVSAVLTSQQPQLASPETPGPPPETASQSRTKRQWGDT